MFASGETLRATHIDRAPRWRALALALLLAGTLWGTGFAMGRRSSPEAQTVPQEGAAAAVSIRPGRDRGQVRFGPVEPAPRLIRPRDHGGGNVRRG
jgi:hypothetical protein